MLIKQLRYADAMKVLLTDEPFDAQEALRIGLVNEVVPHGELMERAEQLCASHRDAAAGGGAHDERVRRAVRRSTDDQAWHVQNLINSLLIQTTMDGEEGRAAFNAKRPPRFTGTLRQRGRHGRSHRRKTRDAWMKPIAAGSFRQRWAGMTPEIGQSARQRSGRMKSLRIS